MPDFHNSARRHRDGERSFPFGEIRENCAPKDTSPILVFRAAQKFGMPLWTSCTRLKTEEIKLRKKMWTFAAAGVKTHSFFDSFAVVPSRQRLRAEASSLRLLLRERTQKNRNGRQRLLAEEYARPVEGKTESRGVERSFRLATSPRFKLNMPCVRQYRWHSPAGTECKSLVENNGPT